MARATLETRLALDTTKFQKGITKAKVVMAQFKLAIGRVAGGLMGVGKNVAKVTAGFLALGAAVSAAVGVGVKKAIDFGGRMSDVRDQTGLSVKNIMIWEEALRAGGMQGENFGKIVTKMQKGISDFALGLSTAKDAFSLMKIKLEDIIDLDPDQQLEMIEKGLGQIENRSMRMGAAMGVFGREGAKLFTVLGSDSAMSRARVSVGAGQLEIFDRMADKMDLVSDRIGGISVKLRGFFGGVADKLVPLLTEATDALTQVDLSGVGQKFGAMIADVVTNLREGISDVPQFLLDGLILVGTSFVKVITDGLIEAVASTAAAAQMAGDILTGKGGGFAAEYLAEKRGLEFDTRAQRFTESKDAIRDGIREMIGAGGIETGLALMAGDLKERSTKFTKRSESPVPFVPAHSTSAVDAEIEAFLKSEARARLPFRERYSAEQDNTDELKTLNQKFDELAMSLKSNLGTLA